jgi:DNA-binding PadR family transcriptional regulator
MTKISNKEAALMGLLSEKPKHAYEIENDIKERDMRYWTEISMSSVYKLLNKLEKEKLLESKIKLSKNNLSQKVYSLTKAGEKVFNEKLKELISVWQPSVHPIDVGLANLGLLNKKSAIAQLEKYSESIDKMIKCYVELEDFLIKSGCPLGNVHLAVRRICLLRAEKEWLNKFIKDYRNYRYQAVSSLR